MKTTTITLTFPDGSNHEFPTGTTGRQVAESIGKRLAQDALAAKLGERIIELSLPLSESGNFSILTWKDLEGKQALWHTVAHLMAEAVTELYPGALPTIGPPQNEGVYYDFAGVKPFNPEDLEKIENKINELLKEKRELVRKEVSVSDAKKLFVHNKFKIELINEFSSEGKNLSVYYQGKFFDLCKGGHVEHTEKIAAVKVFKSSSAYWRADEKNESLQRVYAIGFPEKKLLDEWLKVREEAEKRSHIKLGRELGLFVSSPLVGPGLPLFTQQGTVIREQLSKFLREKQLEAGYLPVTTPHIAKVDLFKTSGHYPYYKDDMFAPMQTPDGDYILKPMNCPFHIQIYNSEKRSYRELPLRLTEFGTVYRYEKSGELQGLTRVRMITQDDAHLFCAPEQVREEIEKVIDLVFTIFKTLDFKDYRARFGVRDDSPKYVGGEENWNKAQADIEAVLQKTGLVYSKGVGEAAFYGPKIDFLVKDVLGREWQLGTVQVDYNLPERFALEYIGSDGAAHRPVMIHRAPFGSLERFMGILIEHFAGRFPPWLAVTQIALLPLSDQFNDHCRALAKRWQLVGYRVKVDESQNTLSYKIRAAQLEQIPFMLVVGEKEIKDNSVTLRTLDGKQQTLSINSFEELIFEKVSKRTLD